MKARWCCSPARPASANRGSRPRFWKASPPSRTRACAISARRSTPTARSIRSSARWNVLPDWRATTPRKRSSTSSMRCWRRPRPRSQDAALFAEMLSLPNDGRYPALDLTPQQRRQRTLEALISQLQALARQNPVLMIFEDAHWTDPTSLEVFGRAVEPHRDTSRIADRDVPAGIRSALDRTTARDRPHHQSAGAARSRRHDRPRRRQQARCRRASGRTSSSAPTAFRCSWRR